MLWLVGTLKRQAANGTVIVVQYGPFNESRCSFTEIVTLRKTSLGVLDHLRDNDMTTTQRSNPLKDEMESK